MTRVLVTGGAGFVGPHLLRLLAREAEHGDLHATSLHLPRRGGGAAVALERLATWRAGDLEDARFCADLVRTVRPELVYHLAGAASVGESWRDPAGTFRGNLVLTANLLAALGEHAPRARVLVVGSNEQYGLVPDGEAISEETPRNPVSPYGISKQAQEAFALAWAGSSELRIHPARSFNHIGPGQDGRFALPSFARDIAKAERGLGPPVLRVGNLDVVRDFTDVRDVARAYLVILGKGRAGRPYNVGSGRGRSLRELVERMEACSRVRLRIEIDSARLRPVDPDRAVCDSTRLREETGWGPVIPIEDTIEDLLDEWRTRLAGVRES